MGSIPAPGPHRAGRSAVHSPAMVRCVNSLLFSVLIAVFAGACCTPSALGAQADSPLAAVPVPPPPPDANGLTRDVLDCGLEVWVHPAGPTRDGTGDVYMGLVIRAGAIDEGNDQRGGAFIAKLASGLERPGLEPGDASRFRTGYRDEGPAFDEEGRGHSAVSHGFVEFRLVFDRSDARAWDAGLSHARALIEDWQPSDEALLEARRMVMERPEPEDADTRARMAVTRALFAGEPLAERPLRPEGEVLARTTPDAVRRYIRERYVPGSAVLVIAGDIEPDEALGLARCAFDGVQPRAVPERGPGINPSAVVGRVSVHRVEGYRSTDVSLIAMGEDARDDKNGVHPIDRDILDRLGALLVGERLRAAAARAEPDLISVEAYAVGWIRGSQIAEVSVRAEPTGAPGAARAAATELARVRRDAWTRQEHQAARARLLDELKGEAARWETASIQSVLRALYGAAISERAWVPPRDALSHAVRLLASTTDRDVAKRARSLFEPARLNAVVVSATERDGLDEALGREMIRLAGAQPPPGAPLDVAPAVLAMGDTPGTVDEIAHHPSGDVWSAVLGNGVVVRVRPLPDDPDAPRFEPYNLYAPELEYGQEASGVTVRTALCDGMVREDADSLGRSREAAGAWVYARLKNADAPALRAWMRQRSLTFRAIESEHRVVLEVNGPPGSARDALELAASLINDPGVDARFVGRVEVESDWNTQGLEALGAMLLSQGDPRARPAPVGEGIDADRANEWLRRLARAPIEASIVGDFDPESVVGYAADTLGTLAPRARPDRPLDAWDDLPRDERRLTIESDRGKGGEWVQGIVFADMPDLRKVRPMVVAGRVLDAELRRLSAERSPDAQARAWIWLGEGIPGRVTLVTRVTGDASAIDGAGTLVDGAIEAVIGGGVTDEAIQAQLDRTRENVERAWERRSFWAMRLSTLSWNGLGVDAIARLPEDYDAITPAMVRETLAGCVGAGVHKCVAVVPPESGDDEE